MAVQTLSFLALFLMLFAISDGQNTRMLVCTPKFTKTIDSQMDGGITISMKNTTNCPDECLSLIGCLGFDFSIRISPPICTLFLQKKAIKRVVGVDHYELDRRVCALRADFVTECMPTNSIEFYKEMLGGHHLPNQPYKKCLDTCYANKDCIGFNFDLDAQMNFAESDCYILTKIGTIRRNYKSFFYRIIKNNACQKHSPVSTRCLSTYEISPNKRMGLSFIAEKKNLTECATLCLQLPSCLAFNFDQNTKPNLCQIVNSSVPLTKYNGIDNYLLKREPCAVLPTTTTTTQPVACNIPNCIICNKNADKCILCDVGFGLNASSQCVACGSNCYLCLFDANVCTNCLHPTVNKLIGGECKNITTTGFASKRTTIFTSTKATTNINPISLKDAQTLFQSAKTILTTVALTTKKETTKITATTKCLTTSAQSTKSATNDALTTKSSTTMAQSTKSATTDAQPTKGATTITQSTKGATTDVLTTKSSITIAQSTKGTTTDSLTTKGATTLAQSTKGATTDALTSKGATTMAQSTKGVTTDALSTKGATTDALTTIYTTIAITSNKPFALACSNCRVCTPSGCNSCLSGFGQNEYDIFNCYKCPIDNCLDCIIGVNYCYFCNFGYTYKEDSLTCVKT